jgi:hypothetical protein
MHLTGPNPGQGLLSASSSHHPVTFFFQKEPARNEGFLLIVDNEDGVT